MENTRTLISSGSPYEKPIGFSRAVRTGNVISVSGTAPISDDGSSAFPGNPYAQAKRCLEIIERAINQAGGCRAHIVSTRMFITDTNQWQEIARAHGEFFAEIRPASTCVQVAGLLDPSWYVEIEADAIVDS